MLPNQIEITDQEIEYSGKLLLPPNLHFDVQQKDFIKNLSTLDLHAVPGSGKTTALLAKLIILEKYLPFSDGSGILVISHTNAAVDEIKNKLSSISPKLFAYPNYVGTIQGFVDKFLALPYYSILYNNKPNRIDSEIYFEKITKYPLNYSAKGYLKNRHSHDYFEFLSKIRFDEAFRLIPEMNKSFNDFELKDQQSTTYKELSRMKADLLSQGWMHYDDAYLLSNIYLNSFPLIIKLQQERFKYVFVDEMQDMDKHQHDLLENLFFGENCYSVYQRIGDQNQSIYDSKVKLDTIWVPRENKLELSVSNRLSKQNADVIKYFGLNFIEINGLQKNTDGSEIDIKPHIIVFNGNTIGSVIEKFGDIIIKLRNEGKIPNPLKYPCKVICWVKKTDADHKLSLSHYFNSDEKKHKPRIDFETLKEYFLIQSDSEKNFKSVRKQVINALLKILREENIKSEDNYDYTEGKLIKYLKEKDESFTIYELFKTKIYQTSFLLIKNQIDESFNLLKEYIPTFLDVFAKTITTSNQFINTVINNGQQQAQIVESNKNIIRKEDIEIEVTTVHSVKGQTHTATLYLESFYSRGQGNHESERLKDQFKFQRVANNALNVVKESAKMVYVGLSRPTHFLCFAVHKDRFDACLSDIDRTKWEIISLE